MAPHRGEDVRGSGQELVLTSAPLDAKDEDPVSRMAADTQRVHMATLARKHDAAGVRGAQDAWAQAAYQREQAAAKPGAATRLMAAGCAACDARANVPLAGVCDACDGWRLRGPRGRRATCVKCGGSTVCATCGGYCGCEHARAIPPTCDAGAALVRTASQRRAAHAESDSDGDSDAWRSTRRRLGTVAAPGAAVRWVGFAGLARTTGGRLLREGDGDAASQPWGCD